MKETVSDVLIDQIVKQIETTTETLSTNNVMVLTGRPSENVDRILRLNQESSTTTTTTTVSAKSTFPGVTLYLAPNLLIGILFMLFVFSILLMGILLLMQVQTPSVFSTEKMDFGKIEKWWWLIQFLIILHANILINSYSRLRISI